MTVKALLDATPGHLEVAHLEDGNLTVEDRYDIEPALDLARLSRDTVTPSKEMRLAAIIPQDVLDRAFREGWYNDKKAWKKWMNEPQNRPFRVWEGRT